MEEIRYDDIYPGIVADDADPERLGRVKITVPAISENFTTDWAWPVMDSAGPDSGWFDPPPIDATVWVKFAEGDPEHARYTGCSWSAPGGQSEVPTEFQRETPTNRGYKSPGGHLLEFDDDDPTKGIRLTSVGGNIINLDDMNELLAITAFADMAVNVAKNLDLNVTDDYTANAKNINRNATTDINDSADGMANFKGTGGTEIGDSGSQTNVNGSQVNIQATSQVLVNGTVVLLGGGGLPVAHVGSVVTGMALIIPVVGSVVTGSSVVQTAP